MTALQLGLLVVGAGAIAGALTAAAVSSRGRPSRPEPLTSPDDWGRQ